MIVVDMNQKNEWGFCFVRVKGVRTLINLLAFVEIHNPRTPLCPLSGQCPLCEQIGEGDEAGHAKEQRMARC